MSKNYTEFYDILANLFRLHIDELGEVYYIGPEIDESYDQRQIIIRNGNHYTFNSDYGTPCERTNSIILGFIRKAFIQALRSNGYYFKGIYTSYKKEHMVRHDQEDIFQLYKGFKNRILIHENEYYICIDPACVLFTVASIEHLANRGINLENLEGFSVRYIQDEENRISGYLLKTEVKNGQIIGTIRLYRCPEGLELPNIINVEANALFPEARQEIIESFLNLLGSPISLSKIIRRLSFLDSATASRDRLVETLKIVDMLGQEIFPLEFGDFRISLSKEPLIVKM